MNFQPSHQTRAILLNFKIEKTKFVKIGDPKNVEIEETKMLKIYLKIKRVFKFRKTKLFKIRKKPMCHFRIKKIRHITKIGFSKFALI